jgi:hypothetical protein
MDQLTNIDSLESVSSLPGMDNLEPRSTKNILSSLAGPNINTSFIDEATNKVSKKMDTILQ